MPKPEDINNMSDDIKEIKLHKGVGICPMCGSDFLDYGDITPSGNDVYYPAKCLNCGCKFKECYSVEYSLKSDIIDTEDNFVAESVD